MLRTSVRYRILALCLVLILLLSFPAQAFDADASRPTQQGPPEAALPAPPVSTAAYTISGRVKDGSSNPISDVTVAAYPESEACMDGHGIAVTGRRFVICLGVDHDERDALIEHLSDVAAALGAEFGAAFLKEFPVGGVINDPASVGIVVIDFFVQHMVFHIIASTLPLPPKTRPRQDYTLPVRRRHRSLRRKNTRRA